MRNIDQDVFSGGCLVVCALVGYFFAAQLENLAVIGLSAAFYPTVLFTTLLIVGLLLIYQGAKRKEKKPLPSINWKNILTVTALLGLYVFLMAYVGFIISTTVFLLVAIYAFGERRKKVFLILPITTSIVVYYLFSTAFRIVLP